MVVPGASTNPMASVEASAEKSMEICEIPRGCSQYKSSPLRVQNPPAYVYTSIMAKEETATTRSPFSVRAVATLEPSPLLGVYFGLSANGMSGRGNQASPSLTKARTGFELEFERVAKYIPFEVMLTTEPNWSPPCNPVKTVCASYSKTSSTVVAVVIGVVVVVVVAVVSGTVGGIVGMSSATTSSSMEVSTSFGGTIATSINSVSLTIVVGGSGSLLDA
mmetsp:Transcript_1003/g.2033  ORF Transcript_1003/g.2033 Transcript_1003/m.2033 type:complete len:220 (+) Transcript_1003:850-1509(+)